MSGQLNAWVTDEVREFIAAQAAKSGVSRSRAAAELLAGMVAAAGGAA